MVEQFRERGGDRKVGERRKNEVRMEETEGGK